MENRPKSEEEIYYAALNEPPDERTSYVKAACGDDLELLERVESLLKVREGGDNFLASPLFVDQMQVNPRPKEKPGNTIDKYKLLEQIGEGGMAVVYMAQQEQPIRRKVALKIIKLGMDTKQVIARFEAERQALALMDHPHIAKVLEAGATDTGRPYFVMELVQGVSITKYCDSQKLNTKERLGLFMQVCNALQHAHQKGIIHRDIKPSNVMVTMNEGTPVPKVIDFGIAKATNQRLTEKTVFTRYAHIIGTPAYMSPEQAELSELDVDTRSDIYSLGVLLYELLTGATPFSEEELRAAGYAEMTRIIREQEPPRPSTRLTQMQAQASHQFKNKKSKIENDLDWIVMKSLEKARDRRYDTANALALDVARHLDNEPVIARPPSVAYRIQKAWQRNKVIYSAGVTIAATLLLGTVISVWQACIANTERERSLRQEQKARQSEAKALQHAYNSDMSLAFRALEENLFGRVQDIVRPYIPEPEGPDLRGWEWRYAWAQSRSDAVYRWDTPEGMGEVVALRISPNQHYMVSSDFYYGPTSYQHSRRLWDFKTRQELKRVQLPGGSRRGFAFSNSGKHLALDCGATDLHGGESDVRRIHIYDTTTWDLETEILIDAWSPSLSFSPDDRALAAIVGKEAVLWDWRAKKSIRRWPAKGSWGLLNVVAFFPDGRCIAVGGNSGLRIIDLTTRDIKHHELDPNSVITALAISPDSCYVAIGFGHENGEIGVLNVASGELEAPLIGHSRTVSSLMYSANGECLISSSADSTVRVWDMDSRISTRVLKGHQLGVGSVSLISGETRAISASNDKQILEWDLTVALPAFREHLLSERVTQVVFSPDSQSFYTVNKKGSVGIWDANTFSKQTLSSGELGKNSAIILSPDGNELIVGTGLGKLWVLDARDLHVVTPPRTKLGRILPVGFLADRQSLVTLEPTNTISFWNTETWELKSSAETRLKIKFINGNFNIYAIPQASDVLLYPSAAELVWWDLELSEELASIRINSQFAGSIAVSPTEPLLASADGGDLIALWNWKTCQFEEPLRGPKAFKCVAFSPVGRRMLTGSHGKGAFMLWDVSTRPIREIAQFGSSSGDLIRVQFSPDGNIICGIDGAGNAHFFQSPSLESINNVLQAEQHQAQRQ
jgi:eukaryotic-like serine/threonine-protein kinase